MPPEEQKIAFENVGEPWLLYDSVLIGPTQKDRARGWYEDFAALGAAGNVNFFNVRNRSTTHPAYNDFDASDDVPFVFWAYSIGIEFWSMPISDTGEDVGGFLRPVDWSENYMKFNAEVPTHSGLEFQVKQDIVLEAPCLALPAGAGINGFTRPLYSLASSPNNTGTFQNLTNGVPGIQNRWPFKHPIGIPRDANIRATVKLSQIATRLLESMDGPGTITLGPLVTDPQVNSCAGITLSLFGKREVQQRGAYHYYP